jgi:hypothetical protein
MSAVLINCVPVILVDEELGNVRSHQRDIERLARQRATYANPRHALRIRLGLRRVERSLRRGESFYDPNPVGD